jgi:hypothetical protein
MLRENTESKFEKQMRISDCTTIRARRDSGLSQLTLKVRTNWRKERAIA